MTSKTRLKARTLRRPIFKLFGISQTKFPKDKRQNKSSQRQTAVLRAFVFISILSSLSSIIELRGCTLDRVQVGSIAK